MEKYRQRYAKMTEKALARGYDEFIHPWNGGINGVMGIVRRTQARKTATGEIEIRVANLKDGEIIYESHWYKQEGEVTR